MNCKQGSAFRHGKRPRKVNISIHIINMELGCARKSNHISQRLIKTT